MKKTNFQMMRELLATYGKMNHEFGWCSEEEVKLIRETLKLKERLDIIELRNLRDFVVLLMDNLRDETEDKFRITDEASAITHVIDCEIYNRGGEV